uniref:Uncharacterized protein n=1 Tax=Anopheles atroparvus TaxID=41427 RepID=A0A182JEG4_ANOAO
NSGVTPVFAPPRFPFGEGIALTSIAVSNIGPHTLAFVDSNDGWIWKSRVPYCGWRSLEKRCTVRTACQKDTIGARWISIGTGQQCIDFEMVVPDRVPIGQMSVVRIVIKTLPELSHNAQYRCVFGNATPIHANVMKEASSARPHR